MKKYYDKFLQSISHNEMSDFDNEHKKKKITTQTLYDCVYSIRCYTKYMETNFVIFVFLSDSRIEFQRKKTDNKKDFFFPYLEIIRT